MQNAVVSYVIAITLTIIIITNNITSIKYYIPWNDSDFSPMDASAELGDSSPKYSIDSSSFTPLCNSLHKPLCILLLSTDWNATKYHALLLVKLSHLIHTDNCPHLMDGLRLCVKTP